MTGQCALRESQYTRINPIGTLHTDENRALLSGWAVLLKRLLKSAARRVPPAAGVLAHRDALIAFVQRQREEIQQLRGALVDKERELQEALSASVASVDENTARASELQAVWDHATLLDTALQNQAQAARTAQDELLRVTAELNDCSKKLQDTWEQADRLNVELQLSSADARTAWARARELNVLLDDRASFLAPLRYQLLNQLASSHPGQSGDLTEFELQVFSQNGEDGVIAEILRRIGVSTRTFVEFGIETGSQGNCVFLADVMGWRGLFMESDPDFCVALRRKYGASDRIRIAETEVTPSNINILLRNHGVPDELDVLSIDIDGNDYWVWKALDAVRPRLVVIEYNPILDPSARLVQPYDESGWDGTEYQGASLGAMCQLAAEKGYQLVHCEIAGVNAFFVRSDLAEPFVDPEFVVRRGPNHFLAGRHHGPDPLNRGYLDLDRTTGEDDRP